MKLKEAFGIEEAPASNKVFTGRKPRNAPQIKRKFHYPPMDEPEADKQSGQVSTEPEQPGEDDDELSSLARQEPRSQKGEPQSVPDVAKAYGKSTGWVDAQVFNAMVKTAQVLVGKSEDGKKGPFYDDFVKKYGHPLDFRNVKTQGHPAYKEIRDLVRNPHFESAFLTYLDRSDHVRDVAKKVAPLILDPSSELGKAISTEYYGGHPLSKKDIENESQKEWFLELIDDEVVKSFKSFVAKDSSFKAANNKHNEDEKYSPAHESKMPSMKSLTESPEQSLQLFKKLIDQNFKTSQDKVLALAHVSSMVLPPPEVKNLIKALASPVKKQESLDESLDEALPGTTGTAAAADPNLQSMKNMLNSKYKTPQEKVQALAMLSKFVLVTPQFRKELADLLSMQ